MNKIRSSWLDTSTFRAFLGALLLAAIYGRVALLNLWSGVIGGDVDGYENLWDDYWTLKSLLSFHNPYFTNYMYYPTGISLRFHTLHPLTALVALPLWPLIGAVATTNLIFVLSLALTNFFSYLLINDIVKKPLVSFAGAALFTFANDQVVNFFLAGQTEKLSAEWLPLYLFFMFRLVYRPQHWKSYATLSLMSLFFLNFTDWQYTIYAVLTTVLFFCYILFTRRSWWEKGLIFARLAGVGAVWGMLIFFPLVLPMIVENSKNIWLNISYQSLDHSLDLLGYIKPDLTNPGYLAMVIMLFGARIGWKESEGVRFWAICGILAALFSLGPKLIINNTLTDIPGPYAILYQLPVFNSGRDPERFYTLTLLAFSILFAFGFGQLIEKIFYLPKLRSTSWITPLAVLVVITISLFSFMLKTGTAKVDPLDTPDFYNQIAQDKENYALLELPLFTENGRGENVYQVYQFIHDKARFGGRWARDHKLANPNNFSKRATYMRDFFWLGRPDQTNLRPSQDFMPTPDFSRVGIPLLNYWNVRYIVLWKEALVAPGELQANRKLVLDALGKEVKPVFEDRRIEVYKVPTAPPLPEKIVLDVGSGWYPAASNSEGAYRWANPVENLAELYLQNLSNAPVRATLKLKIYNHVPEGDRVPRSVTVAVNGYPATTYQFGGLKEEKVIELEVIIPSNKDAPAGFTIITFTSPEAARPASPDRKSDARILSFGVRQISLTLKES